MRTVGLKVVKDGKPQDGGNGNADNAGSEKPGKPQDGKPQDGGNGNADNAGSEKPGKPQDGKPQK